MPLHRYLFLGGLAAVLIPLPLAAQCAPFDVAVTPDRDATLYEGANEANGAGDHLFAGNTAFVPPPGRRIRRALLRFDVGAALPPGSVVNSATLWLTASRVANSALRDVRLHPLLRDWGEGTSHAAGQEGIGTAATPGDATWFLASFNTTAWTTPGGDFGPASATAPVGDLGVYAWTSAALVLDVQGWIDAPASNFGWILVGDETVTPSAKRFDSRTHPGGTGPVLCIDAALVPPPDPTSIPALDGKGLAVLAVLLALLALGHLRKTRQEGRP